ncbi:MAG: tRNA-modifying protein YgfZ, partial [Pseudomonadota bacterium]
AVDFDKGCYLGQEVVARAQHRGAVKRALCHLRLAAATAPASGPGHAPVNAAPAAPAGEPGARLGQLVQRAGAHALAVLKAPFPAAQTPVEIGLSTETVTAFVLS